MPLTPLGGAGIGPSFGAMPHPESCYWPESAGGRGTPLALCHTQNALIGRGPIVEAESMVLGLQRWPDDTFAVGAVLFSHYTVRREVYGFQSERPLATDLEKSYSGVIHYE